MSAFCYRPCDPCDGPTASIWATRGSLQDRCQARLGLGARRAALFWAAHPVRVWLTFGLRPAGRRDEAWLKRGLPSS
jgi:hypothetical protein